MHANTHRKELTPNGSPVSCLAQASLDKRVSTLKEVARAQAEEEVARAQAVQEAQERPKTEPERTEVTTNPHTCPDVARDKSVFYFTQTLLSISP